MAKASEQRKKNRHAVKQLKKKLPLSKHPSPTNPLEVPHLRKLEGDLEQLGEAFNHNAKIYGHALTVAEMRLRVLERAMHDQLRGTLRTLEIDGQKEVDFEFYVNNFACCMIMTEFAEWARGLMSKYETAPSSPLVGLPGYDEAVIFGGGP